MLPCFYCIFMQFHHWTFSGNQPSETVHGAILICSTYLLLRFLFCSPSYIYNHLLLLRFLSLYRYNHLLPPYTFQILIMGRPIRESAVYLCSNNIKYFPNSYPIYLNENKSIIFSINLDCCLPEWRLCPKTVPMMCTKKWSKKINNIKECQRTERKNVPMELKWDHRCGVDTHKEHMPKLRI